MERCPNLEEGFFHLACLTRAVQWTEAVVLELEGLDKTKPQLSSEFKCTSRGLVPFEVLEGLGLFHSLWLSVKILPERLAQVVQTSKGRSRGFRNLGGY